MAEAEFQHLVTNFMIESGIISEEFDDCFDAVIELHADNPILINFLKSYARENFELDFNCLDQSRGDQYFNKKILESCFEAADAYQLYEFIYLKLKEVNTQMEIHVISSFVCEYKDNLYRFKLRKGTKLIYHRNKLKDFNLNKPKLRKFSDEEEQYFELVFNGYYSIYKTAYPLNNCVYSSINYIKSLYNIVNMEAIPKSKDFLENYLLELLDIDGIYDEDYLYITNRNLTKMDLIEVTHVTDIVAFYDKIVSREDREYFINELITQGKYHLLEKIAQHHPSVDKILPKDSDLEECHVIKIKISDKKLIHKFDKLAFKQLGFHLCDSIEETRLIAYQKLNDKIKLRGILVYFQIGNIYYIINSQLRKVGKILIDRLKEKAEQKDVKYIVINGVSPVYQDIGFKAFKYNKQYMYLKV